MWTQPQKTADLLTFNGKLHFLCREYYWFYYNNRVKPIIQSLASFSSNLIASLSYILHKSTIDTDYLISFGIFEGLELSAQELLHNNQYTFRT